MVVFLLHTESVSGSSPLITTKFRPISIMVLHLFCNQVTAVRFCHGAPILGFFQQIKKLLLSKSKKRILFYFPLVVKWYNSRLITGHYKFDSCREDQFYLCKVLSGCIRGLGPCGLGSNPSMETNFLFREIQAWCKDLTVNQ